MITIDLTFGGDTSLCHIGEGILGDVQDLVCPFVEASQAFVVTDATVGPLYGLDVAERLDAPVVRRGSISWT